MPDRPSAVSGALRQPFREQVAFFRAKLGNLVPTERWDDIEREQHDVAFMVAGAQKADLLADLAASVDRAIAEGKSLDAFRRDFDAAVDRHDWHGWTGEGTRGGRAWRTRTIYRTNARVSYAAGRRAQLEAGNYPFWVYRHGGSRDPRPEHLALDGLVLPSDDPAWTWLYPPSDWGCSCYVVGARSERAARRLGGDPDKQRPAWFGQIDLGTGAPIGVGKGWDYAPGSTVAQAVTAAARKVGNMEQQVAKAFLYELPVGARDAIAEAYRRLPSVADDARRYAQRVLRDDGEDEYLPALRPIGLLTSGEVERIEQLLGRRLDGYDLRLTPSAVRHVEKQHGVGNERDQAQRAVEPADYAQLIAVLAAPDSVEAGDGAAVVFTRRLQGQTYVAIFEVLGKRRSLSLKTFYIKRR